MINIDLSTATLYVPSSIVTSSHLRFRCYFSALPPLSSTTTSMTQTDVSQDEYEQGAGPGAPIPVSQLVVGSKWRIRTKDRR